MTQQLLSEAKGKFYSVYQVFAKPGQNTSVIQDARKVLRGQGGPMHISDISKILWFILVPYIAKRTGGPYENEKEQAEVLCLIFLIIKK